jgi:hypothetical protein
VPLHGKGGSPIKLKKHSVQEKSLNLYDYRQNLHKETLKLELAEPEFDPKGSPRTRQQLEDKSKTSQYSNDFRSRNSYSEAPIVQ